MSKKVYTFNELKAAEEYLASLNNSKERLTKEQLGEVLEYVRARWVIKYTRIFLLLFSIILIIIFFVTQSIYYIKLTKIVPNNAVLTVEYVSGNHKKIEFNDIWKNYTTQNFISAATLSIAMLFMFGAINIHSKVKDRRKILEPFLKITKDTVPKSEL